MTDIEIIVAVVFGLWLLGLSIEVRHMQLWKVDWEDHERYASRLRDLEGIAVMQPRWYRRLRFWHMVWRHEWERAKRDD